jgi:hypothetical protein
MTPLGLDDVFGRRHRGVPPTLIDGFLMKCLCAARTQPHEELERCEDDAQIVELPESRNEIRYEVDW